MILKSGLLLFQVHLTAVEENCTESCLVCDNGICLSCITGYYGEECKICSSHCKDFSCERLNNFHYSKVCVNECEDEWFDLLCDKKCDEKCESGRCDLYSGHCYDNSGHDCLVGVCSDDCQQYCDEDDHDDDGYHYDDGHDDYSDTDAFTVTTAGLVVAACCIICYLVNSIWNLRKFSRNNPSIKIIPSKQRILPGHPPEKYSSGNKTHTHAHYSDAFLDSNNVLTFPSNSPVAVDVTLKLINLK